MQVGYFAAGVQVSHNPMFTAGRCLPGLIVECPMLKFRVFHEGQPIEDWPVRNAYLVGADGSAMRGTVAFEDGMILCRKQEMGAASLVVQQQAGRCGEMTLQTCLLPERDEPYLLNLELARHRLMVLYNKSEDWAMFELGPDHPVTKRFDAARENFVNALCSAATDAAEADKLAEIALEKALDGSEELAIAHADLLLNRRKEAGAMPRRVLGCGIDLSLKSDRIRMGLAHNFDFLMMPLPWRDLCPTESDYNWAPFDQWAEWTSRVKLPVMAGPVISFEPTHMPDWAYIWEHDYEQLRDLVYEHVERVVGRYRNVVNSWLIASGLHINKHVSLNFDQLMDLTRMSAMIVKKTQPNARVAIEIAQPFGEYFASNQRSIPPMMYADLLVQSAVNFDTLSLKLLMGQAVSGQFTRDLMQISNLVDQFAGLGKGVHVTLAAPSEPVTEIMIASQDGKSPADPNCGYWRQAWSPQVQSHWLEAVLNVLLSKPFVETVAWMDFVDHAKAEMPLSGLVTEELQPKPAYRRLVNFKKSLNESVPVETATADQEARSESAAELPQGDNDPDEK